MPMQALPLNSMSQVPGEMESGRPEGDGSTLLSEIFRVDFDRLITEEVRCAGKPIKALIDTRDDYLGDYPTNSVGVRSGGKAMERSRGIDGEWPARKPISAVDIELETTRGRVEREILMKPMDEVLLLLGMDILSQHGRIELETTRGRVEGENLRMQIYEV